MRRDELDLPPPPANDRPSDPWTYDDDIRRATWSAQRRAWSRRVILIALVFSAVTLGISQSSIIFQPGPLSTPHAQILNGTVTRERCAACHPKSSLSPLDWLTGQSDAHRGENQNMLCMECHRESIDHRYAGTAHNLSAARRNQLTSEIRLASRDESPRLELATLLPKTKLDQENLSCSVCHKEHHGARADLNALTDAQCQSCHSQRFGAFAKSHPSWNEWPYGRGNEIAFNHASHQKHFANARVGAAEFQCSRCHFDTKTLSRDSLIGVGELTRSASYELSCASCHDESLRTQLHDGIALLSLPMIPTPVAERLQTWPDSATGAIDGVLPPLTELLLRSDSGAVAALRMMEGGDLGQIRDDDPEVVVEAIAAALTRLLTQLAEGQDGYVQRLRQQGLTPQPMAPVIRSLPPQWIGGIRRDWFGDAPKAATPDPAQALRRLRPTLRLVAAEEDDLLIEDEEGDLLSGDLLSGDLLSGDPLDSTDDPLEDDFSAGPNPTVKDPASELTHGGWLVDDLRMKIHYRGMSHADDVLVGLIETFGQLRQGDPLKERFLQLRAVQACVRCHTAATEFPATWKSTPQIGDRSQFSKFTHRPHLNVSELGDCVHCHQIMPAGAASGGSVSEFRPLGIESCAACHTPSAAGDSCTTCHRYHIHP